MFNGNISMKFYDMSQFARSNGKKKNCTNSTLCIVQFVRGQDQIEPSIYADNNIHM